MPIREEGLPFALPTALLGAVLFLLGSWVTACALLILLIFTAAFFRDPERHFPGKEDILTSPADGRIVKVNADGDRLTISVFMSVFNVHVNRSPVCGRVLGTRYNPGKFMAAWSDKASMDNEQVSIFMETSRGPIEIVLIAGLVARRIVCWARGEKSVTRGERVGLIRFGSRVDLHLPAGEAEALVAIGDRVKAGKTPVAQWKNKP